MKKLLPLGAVALLLCGCSADQKSPAGISLVYGILAVLALLLCVICLLSRIKSPWLKVLFICVTVVNTGYWLLSVSDTLSLALNANRLAYLGSVFLPLSMLMLTLRICRYSCPRWLTLTLVGVSVAVFLLAASYPWLDLYYQNVTLGRANGISVLNKEYGVLHNVYFVYLALYLVATGVVAVRATVRHRLDTGYQAVMLFVALFINICVWLLEQFVHFGFEMLSLSYIISELFLLGLAMISRETDRLVAAARAAGQPAEPPKTEPLPQNDPALMESLRYFKAQLPLLTPAERGIYQLYLSGHSSRSIQEALSISENTLKYHNKNIYSKLGVSSRKQLLQLGAAAGEKSQADY